MFGAITLLLQQVTIDGWTWLPDLCFWNPSQKKILMLEQVVQIEESSNMKNFSFHEKISKIILEPKRFIVAYFDWKKLLHVFSILSIFFMWKSNQFTSQMICQFQLVLVQIYVRIGHYYAYTKITNQIIIKFKKTVHLCLQRKSCKCDHKFWLKKSSDSLSVLLCLIHLFWCRNKPLWHE